MGREFSETSGAGGSGCRLGVVSGLQNKAGGSAPGPRWGQRPQTRMHWRLGQRPGSRTKSGCGSGGAAPSGGSGAKPPIFLANPLTTAPTNSAPAVARLANPRRPRPRSYPPAHLPPANTAIPETAAPPAPPPQPGPAPASASRRRCHPLAAPAPPPECAGAPASPRRSPSRSTRHRPARKPAAAHGACDGPTLLRPPASPPGGPQDAQDRAPPPQACSNAPRDDD
jgi:hypothetical protein